MKPRVVLDTNCLVSALLFSKQPLAWLRHSWQNGDIIPLASKETVSELIRVLAYPKFKLTRLLADFLPYVETVKVVKVPEGLPIIRDSKDQMFLNLAVVAKADVLVSGDEDILTIQAIFHTPPIMRLTEFKTWLSNV
jgi:putative PIN family toxin of toxin-antitoxin system